MKSSLFVRLGIVVALLSTLLVLVVLAVMTYGGSATTGFFGLLVHHHVLIMVLLVLVSLATGAGLVLNLSAQNASNEKAARTTADMLLTFLSDDERTIIHILARNSGSALQSQLSSSGHLSVVKTHRVLGRLESKRFITLERYGKTNKVLLSPALAQALGVRNSDLGLIYAKEDA